MDPRLHHSQGERLRQTPPGPRGSTGAPPEGQLEVLQLLGLQPDTGGPGPAPQPLGTGVRTDHVCRARKIPVVNTQSILARSEQKIGRSCSNSSCSKGVARVITHVKQLSLISLSYFDIYYTFFLYNKNLLSITYLLCNNFLGNRTGNLLFGELEWNH